MQAIHTIFHDDDDDVYSEEDIILSKSASNCTL